MHCECLRLADWPPEEGQEDVFGDERWIGEWFLGEMLHLCFPPRWQCDDGAGWKFLPVLRSGEVL